MGFLDRAIEAISPRWAAGREYYRTVLHAARAYDAAKTGRRTEGWITGGTSANAELGPAAARIRNRARDLVRNNPWAAAAVRKLAAKTVGIGIMPRLAVPEAEVDRKKAAADAWNAFVKNSDPHGQLDFYGQQGLVARTVFEAGEALVRFIPRPASWRLPVPLQLQVLEPDYLDSARTQALAQGGAVIQGVEYDRDGRRVAYWLFDEHPGEIVPQSWRASLQSRRVPASEVLHIFDPLRPGQARGVSVFAPVVLRMRDVDDYDDAEIVRKKIAACFAGFVKRAQGPANAPLVTGSTTTDEQGRRVETLQPGTIQHLALGDEITFATPPAAEGYGEFMTMQLHAVAAGIGVTYEQLTGDLSRINYSSYRGGLIDFLDLVDWLQWRVFVPQLCEPVWARVGNLLAVTGKRDLSLPWEARWTPPRRRLFDPVKEIQANKDAMRSGQATLADIIAEQGEDPNEQLEEIAAMNQRLDELGIVLDSDPRRVSNAGLAQARPTGTEMPSELKNEE